MIYDEIKRVYLENRKARNATNVASLSTLIGEIETLAKSGKGMDDVAVIATVKKFVKNIDDTIHFTKEASILDELVTERRLYESFLPKQLSVEELETVIDGYIASGLGNVGAVMKQLKLEHAGLYDGGKASEILKSKFSSV